MDDTIILAEGDTVNLWSMKSILRGFELMTSLRVNFHKSNIYGINVRDWYLDLASTFCLAKSICCCLNSLVLGWAIARGSFLCGGI